MRPEARPQVLGHRAKRVPRVGESGCPLLPRVAPPHAARCRHPVAGVELPPRPQIVSAAQHGRARRRLRKRPPLLLADVQQCELLLARHVLHPQQRVQQPRVARVFGRLVEHVWRQRVVCAAGFAQALPAGSIAPLRRRRCPPCGRWWSGSCCCLEKKRHFHQHKSGGESNQQSQPRASRRADAQRSNALHTHTATMTRRHPSSQCGHELHGALVWLQPASAANPLCGDIHDGRTTHRLTCRRPRTTSKRRNRKRQRQTIYERPMLAFPPLRVLECCNIAILEDTCTLVHLHPTTNALASHYEWRATTRKFNIHTTAAHFWQPTDTQLQHFHTGISRPVCDGKKIAFVSITVLVDGQVAR